VNDRLRREQSAFTLFVLVFLNLHLKLLHADCDGGAVEVDLDRSIKLLYCAGHEAAMDTGKLDLDAVLAKDKETDSGRGALRGCVNTGRMAGATVKADGARGAVREHEAGDERSGCRVDTRADTVWAVATEHEGGGVVEDDIGVGLEAGGAHARR
jgi:hypothetical protein